MSSEESQDATTAPSDVHDCSKRWLFRCRPYCPVKYYTRFVRNKCSLQRLKSFENWLIFREFSATSFVVSFLLEHTTVIQKTSLVITDSGAPIHPHGMDGCSRLRIPALESLWIAETVTVTVLQLWLTTGSYFVKCCIHKAARSNNKTLCLLVYLSVYLAQTIASE